MTTEEDRQYRGDLAATAHAARSLSEGTLRLENLSSDTDAAVDTFNPVRQVIVNTHSPTVVMQVTEESLILAEPVREFAAGKANSRLALP